jgi:hypothetical protein
MIRNCLKTLDSGFRRNDGKWYLLTFYESISFLKNNFKKNQKKLISGIILLYVVLTFFGGLHGTNYFSIPLSRVDIP